MANNIVVSTLGTERIDAGGRKGVCAVDYIIEVWKRRLEQVFPDRPDLIVLPELCDHPRGYPFSCSEYYQLRGDRVLDFFAGTAKRNRCHIAYAAARWEEDGTFRNSIRMIGTNGEIIGVYDKNYITFEEDEAGIIPGKDIAVIDCGFGRVGCAICFDLNFTELLGRYARAKPDLMIFSSFYHGGLMQEYWAYACRAWFVGAMCYTEKPDTVINPLGEVIARGSDYEMHLTTGINLDYVVVHLDKTRESLNAMKAEYGREVTIRIPPFLGCALVTSETDRRSAAELAREFSVELLDDYLARAAELRA